MLPDSTGAPIRLGDLWADRPALLLFWRHWGCGCGVGRAELLREQYGALAEEGAEIVVIGQGEPERAAWYATSFDLPCRVVCDVDGSAYEAYGLLEMSPWLLLGEPKPDMASFEAMIPEDRAKGRPVADNPFLLPGEFVVDRHGRLVLSYRYQYCDNYPDLETLTGAIAEAMANGRASIGVAQSHTTWSSWWRRGPPPSGRWTIADDVGDGVAIEEGSGRESREAFPADLRHPSSILWVEGLEERALPVVELVIEIGVEGPLVLDDTGGRMNLREAGAPDEGGGSSNGAKWSRDMADRRTRHAKLLDELVEHPPWLERPLLLDPRDDRDCPARPEDPMCLPEPGDPARQVLDRKRRHDDIGTSIGKWQPVGRGADPSEPARSRGAKRSHGFRSPCLEHPLGRVDCDGSDRGPSADRGPRERPGPGAEVDDDGSATDGLGDEVEEPKTGGLDDRRPPALIARREPVVSRDELRHAALPIERLGAASTSNDTRPRRRTLHEQAMVSAGTDRGRRFELM
jgi:hypothetical protein